MRGSLWARVVGAGHHLSRGFANHQRGTNAGSNLTAVRNLFTASDQVSSLMPPLVLTSVCGFSGVQANDNLVVQGISTVRLRSPTCEFSAGQGEPLTRTAPSFTRYLAFQRRRFYLEDAIKLKPSVELRIGFRGEFTSGWKEAQGRVRICVRHGLA